MPFALSVATLAAGLAWAVWVGFSETVTGAGKLPGPLGPLHVASRPFLASFLAGFGASGLSVRLFSGLSAARGFGLAAASGLLVALVVRGVVGLAAGEDPS